MESVNLRFGNSCLEKPLEIVSLHFEHPPMIYVLLTGKPTRTKLYMFYFVVGFGNGPIMLSLT